VQALNDFLAVARRVTCDLTALEQAAQFLDFKLRATEHLREQILQLVNKGVTTFEWVRETSAPGTRTGPMSRETESRVALFLLNLNLDAFLVETVSVRDGILQITNAAFDLGFPLDKVAVKPIHQRVTEMFEKELGVLRATGLEAWGAVKLDPVISETKDLRNEATHRNLVKLEETKAWKTAPPPPGPGKWRGEFAVVVSATKQVPLDRLVAQSSQKARELARVALQTLQGTLDVLMWQRGGPQAAALRRAWRAVGHKRRCPHGTVEHLEERVDSAVYGGRGARSPKEIYYCVECGERVRNVHKRKSPDESIHWDQ
jgi:hypothetical protein